MNKPSAPQDRAFGIRRQEQTFAKLSSERRGFAALIWLLTLLACGSAQAQAAEIGAIRPMPIVTADTANQRWLGKPVIESRLLDDMEQTNHWSHLGRGEMTFTSERAHQGQQSVRLRCATKGDKPAPGGRPWGECVARRNFQDENWTQFNRLSFWVYPHLPGFKVISMLVKLRNEGAVKVPDSYNREGLNFFLLQPGVWNHVVWEIPHLARDRVTGVEFIYRQQGHEPGATSTAQFDVDQLELQQVEVDHFEGWAVAPGRIAYSHSGYSRDGQKLAFASGLEAPRFDLIDAASGRTVLSRAVLKRQTPTGQFEVLDFSELQEPGEYQLRVGPIRSRPFPVRDDVWAPSVAKTINLFACERCGFAVQGIHDICHQDWRATHNSSNLTIHGGWHDAGDLSQGLVNTAESAYGMIEVLRTLSTQPSPPGESLDRRALEDELRWGLQWILKTRFGDGTRVTWATMDFWTDGQVGTVDDVKGEVRNSPLENFVASATEAAAAQLIRTNDSRESQRYLAAAREDWEFGVQKLPASPGLELAAYGALASIELFRASHQPERRSETLASSVPTAGQTAVSPQDGQKYADKAVELATSILGSQQREFTGWAVPMAGFYYSSPRRDRILHYAHRGHEQAPTLALVKLCEDLPDHPDWMKWYSAVVLHSEYLRRAAEFTQPYQMLCASVYSLDESNDPRFQEQVRKGIPLSDKHYLRRFPVWFDFRGNSGTILSQAKALAAAMRLRRDEPPLRALVERQLQWHTGLNPFGQSLMFGEGHDYAPQYTALSGDMVGSLPVGVQTRANEDTPYWPAANCYNYKEVWVHPSARWLSILSELWTPRPARSLDPIQSASWAARGTGSIDLQCRVRGMGPQEVVVRSHNLRVSPSPRAVALTGSTGADLTWEAQILSSQEPWVAVIFPQGHIDQRRELWSGWPGPKGGDARAAKPRP